MKQLFFLSILTISLYSQMRRVIPNPSGLLGSNQNQANGFNRNQNNREPSQEYTVRPIFLLFDVKLERSDNIKRKCIFQ